MNNEDTLHLVTKSPTSVHNNYSKMFDLGTRKNIRVGNSADIIKPNFFFMSRYADDVIVPSFIVMGVLALEDLIQP